MKTSSFARYRRAPEMGMIVLSVYVVLGVLLMLPSMATAEDGEEILRRAQEYDARAVELFRSGDFQGAMTEMQAAQALLPSTVRLYNMAACHERLGHRPEAIDLYQRFASASDAPADRAAAARERATQLRHELADDVTSLREPIEIIDPFSEDDEADDARETSSTGGASGSTEPTQGAPPTGRRRLRPVAFWATFGVTLALGVALTAVGAIALVRDRELEDQITSFNSNQSDLTRDEIIRNGDDWRVLADVTDAFLGLTCASALAAVILAIFTGFDGRSSVGRVRFSTTAVATGGALLSGSF